MEIISFFAEYHHCSGLFRNWKQATEETEALYDVRKQKHMMMLVCEEVCNSST